MGGKELVVWAVRNNRKMKDIAVELGVNERRVSRWRHGKSKPSMKYALAIEQMTGGHVRVEMWGGVYGAMAELLAKRAENECVATQEVA